MTQTLPQTQALCVYGFPNREILDWVQEASDHFLVVLEEDEAVLLENQGRFERVYFCHPDSTEGIRQVLWKLVFLTFGFLENPGNASKSSEAMEQVFARVSYLQQGIFLTASDFQDRGIRYLRNYLGNAKHLNRAQNGLAMGGNLEGATAIVCGAGTSLEEVAPLIRKKQGFVFAAGTAVLCLEKMGIQPDFVGVIDPHEPGPRWRGAHWDVPTFFQGRVHSKYLEMGGELIWLPGSENDLFDEEHFEGGWNAATFLAAVAVHLGASQIILAGIDLLQTKDKSYAYGVSRSEEGELIPLDREGLFSRPDWLMAAEFLSALAKAHPQVHWVNLSKGLELAHFSKNLQPLIRCNGLQKGGQVSSLNADALKASFVRVGELCKKLISVLGGLFPNSPEKSSEYALLVSEIEEEQSYQKFFVPVWEIWKHGIAREIPSHIPPAFGLELNKWLFIVQVCDEQKTVFS